MGGARASVSSGGIQREGSRQNAVHTMISYVEEVGQPRVALCQNVSELGNGLERVDDSMQSSRKSPNNCTYTASQLAGCL